MSKDNENSGNSAHVGVGENAIPQAKIRRVNRGTTPIKADEKLLAEKLSNATGLDWIVKPGNKNAVPRDTESRFQVKGLDPDALDMVQNILNTYMQPHVINVDKTYYEPGALEITNSTLKQVTSSTNRREFWRDMTKVRAGIEEITGKKEPQPRGV